jgi:YesN/AraC family two-component response regulator
MKGKVIMESTNRYLIQEFLSELKVDIIISGCNRVSSNWQDLDYIPDYNKFYFIMDGVGWLKVDGIDYYPQKNELFLMPQGVLQSYSITDPENTYLKYWFHFTAKIGEYNLFDMVKAPLYFKVKDPEYVSSLFENLLKIHQSKDCITYKLQLQSYLFQIISYYLENIDASQITVHNTTNAKRISSIIEYINQNLDKNFTLEELAGHLHLQPNYFIRLFKKYTHYSPMSYVNKLKIDRSVMLLKSTDYRINEISEQLGFCNEFYFSKTFKKAIGFTPKDYRKMFLAHDK